MPDAGELAELAIDLSRQHVDEMRAALVDAAGGDWATVREAAEVVRKRGEQESSRLSSPEHIAFALLSDTFRILIGDQEPPRPQQKGRLTTDDTRGGSHSRRVDGRAGGAGGDLTGPQR
jgi:hypothetical protein